MLSVHTHHSMSVFVQVGGIAKLEEGAIHVEVLVVDILIQLFQCLRHNGGVAVVAYGHLLPSLQRVVCPQLQGHHHPQHQCHYLFHVSNIAHYPQITKQYHVFFMTKPDTITLPGFTFHM